MFNVRSGRNGGLESALRAMTATGVVVDCGVHTDTTITDDTYTQFSSGYKVFASSAISAQQGGIVFFWRNNNLYEIEETKIQDTKRVPHRMQAHPPGWSHPP